MPETENITQPAPLATTLTSSDHYNAKQVGLYGSGNTVKTLMLQPKLTVGAPNDPFEQEADAVADKVMQMPESSFIQKKSALCCDENNSLQRKPVASFIQLMGGGNGNSISDNLSNKIEATYGGGATMDGSTRSFMETRFGADFSNVKIHTTGEATQLSNQLNAEAFTTGNNIYFNSGMYNPEGSTGKQLLAHELTHVIQQRKAKAIQRQVPPPATTAAPAPSTASATPATPVTTPVLRRDVVYVMGSDTFHAIATRFFRARYPQATFASLTNLEAILTHLTANFTTPLGNIYIVTHANEDGTVAFGLNSADTDNRLSVVELRSALHPTGGGPSSLTNVSALVDAQTRVQIKGCDLGRNQTVVELFDEAFGGSGVVSAPTHEQEYSENTGEIRTGTTNAMQTHLAAFELTLPAIPAAPTPVPRGLTGAALTQARAEFNAATRLRNAAQLARTNAIAAERRAYTAEAERLGTIAGTHEALSGPMFQRPGTQLFDVTELQPQLDSLYPHLSLIQRTRLAERLVAADGRAHAVAMAQGVFQQQGQRLYTINSRFTYTAPQNLAEAIVAFASMFTRDHFTPTSVQISSTTVNATTINNYAFAGNDSRPGRTGNQATYSATSAPVPDDAVLLAQVRAGVNNPEKFDWRVDVSQGADGILTKNVVRERVVAYLHHGDLDATAGSHFMPPTTDRRFFAESTFAPPPPVTTPTTAPTP